MSAPIPNTVSLPSLYNLRTRISTHLALAVAARPPQATPFRRRRRSRTQRPPISAPHWPS